MQGAKADIIAQLQKELLPLLGFKPVVRGTAVNLVPAPIKNAFPNNEFPLGAVHEFCCAGAEDAAATSGFIAGIIAGLMQLNGACLWISSSRTIFPPALASLGIAPDRIIFIDLQKEKDVLWAMEEALKCKGLAAVVGEIPNIDFTASRRLQLAVEKSRVTGFILRLNSRRLNTTACVTRWRITSLPSKASEDDMPGVGFPRWKVELVKVRNGKPGTWEIEWKAGRFKYVPQLTVITAEQQKKAG